MIKYELIYKFDIYLAHIDRINMRYFLCLIFLSLTVLGHGQQMKLGFRGGGTFSNFYSHNFAGDPPGSIFEQTPSNSGQLLKQPPPDYFYTPSLYYETGFIKDMRVGFFSYLTLNWEIEQRISAEVGLGYVQKGINMAYNLISTWEHADNKTEILSYQLNRNLRLDYISIPFTLQYKVDRKERFYVLAGVYNSIAINFLAKDAWLTEHHRVFESSNKDFAPESTSMSLPSEAYARRFDSGLLTGFGVNFPFAKNMIIGIDVRSAVGLINIPAKYEERGFLNFRDTAKNISFETGLNLQYVLK